MHLALLILCILSSVDQKLRIHFLCPESRTVHFQECARTSLPTNYFKIFNYSIIRYYSENSFWSRF